METEKELVPVPVKRRVEEQHYISREYPNETEYDDGPKEMPKRWYVY